MHKRLPVLRVPRWIQQLTTIFILVIVLTVGAVYLPRLAPDSYHCLRYDEDRVPFIADIRTGSFSIDQRSILATKAIDITFPSPNGQYKAVYIIPLQGKPKLYLEKIGGEGGILETDATDLRYDVTTISWHPQSIWLAYLRQQAFGLQLNIVQPNGLGRQSIPLTKPNLNLAVEPSAVFGVSIDEAYYAFLGNDGQQLAFHFLPLVDMAQQKVIPTDITAIRYEWSPKGHMLAVIDPQKGILQIVSPENGIIQLFKFESSSQLIEMLWSPDSNYVAVLLAHKNATANGTISVYGLNGQQFSEASKFTWGNTLVDASAVSINWHSNSQTIVFLEPLAGRSEHYKLRQFNIAKQQMETISEDIVFVERSYPQTHNRVPVFALKQEHEGKNDLYLLLSGTAKLIPILRDADAINRFEWSPDQNKMAVAWAVGGQNKITVSDVYNNAAVQTLDIDGTLQIVTWSADNKWMAYTLNSENRLVVELLDSVTGQRFRLGDKLTTARLRAENELNLLSFEWGDSDGKRGVDVYTPAGVRIARFPITGTTQLFQYAVSPNVRSIALIFDVLGSDLEITAADGVWHKAISRGQVRFDYPLWSPDSKYLAFAYIAQNTPFWESNVEVVTSIAEAVWQDNSLDTPQRPFQWTKCY